MCGFVVYIQGKSRMRSFRTYGTVRGAALKRWPYPGLFMRRPRVEQFAELKPEAQAKFVRSPASLAFQASIST